MVDVRPAATPAKRTPVHQPSNRLAAIMSGVGVPASELGVTPVRPVAEQSEQGASEAQQAPEKTAKPEPRPKPKPKAKLPVETDPARHWVQVAGGANEDMLARAYKRVADDAPELFRGKTAWTAKLRATNRVLVGPFDSAGDAQDFVNALAKKGVSAFGWNSEKGEAVQKLKLK